MTVATATQTASFSNILESNKNDLAKIEEFKNAPITTKARNLAFGGMMVGGFALFVLFAAQIITGMLALVVTVGAAAGTWYGLKFLRAMDPVIQQKTKNARLKWMVEEARKNAIFQLDNQVIVNKQRLGKARDARDKMNALVMKLERKIDPKNAGTPNHTRKTEMLNKVRTAYETMAANLDKGAKANNEFKQKVKEYKDMDSFTALAGEAMSMLGASGAKELEEMLSLAAFDSIETGFDSAVSAIEHAAADYANDNF